MGNLYLLSLIFSVIIFLVLISLISFSDHKARIRIQKRFLPQDAPPAVSRKKQFLKILDEFKLPAPITRIVDERTFIWSGIRMTQQQFLAIWWLVFLLTLFLGVITSGFGIGGLKLTLLVILLVLITVIGPFLYLKYRIREREREVERSLPDFLDMLTFTVEAGLGLVPALKRVSSGFRGALGEEMHQTLVQIELGFSRREALKGFGERLPSADVEHFVEAVLLSERLGTSLARTLRVQSNLLRIRRRQRAEVKAQTAPIRIIPALVFFFLPSLLLIYLAPPIINFLFRR